MRARRGFAGVLAAAIGLAASPLAADAQRIGGTVASRGWGEPVAGAAVLLLDSVAAETVAQRTTDADGRFVFDAVAPGVYHLQATSGGLQSELLGPFAVRAGDEADALLVELPSALLNYALECSAGEATQPRGVLVGVAYEGGTGMPLPGAVVSLEWQRAGAQRHATARADARGHYRFCDAPAELSLRVFLTALNRVADPIEGVELEADAILRLDVPLESGIVASSTEVTAMRRLADGSTVLAGRIVDAESGEPVRDAAVQVDGARAVATDADGRFRVEGAAAGTRSLSVQRLGYDALETSVDVNAGFQTELELRLGSRAIALEAIRVDAAATRARMAPTTASRSVSGADLQRAIERGATLPELVRASFPVQVREWRDREGRILLCIEGRRREIMAEDPDVYSLDELPVECGETVAIVVDDVLLHDPVGFYRAARLDFYETVEYMPPLEAGIRFGLAAGRAGAIILWSIGRTPRR